MVDFIIVSSGYNCSGMDVKCIKSVLAQTYPNFKAWFVNDGSTDDTLSMKSLEWINDHRIHVWHHLTNEGAAKRRFEVLKFEADQNPEAVVILLGLDDELLPGALERIAKEYEAGKWVTYGNWRNQHGKMLPKGFLQFDEETHRHRDYRKVKYRSTAPNTFKKFLFDQLTEEDFKLDGKWIDSTTESALMFACLEMAGYDKIGVIEDPIYLYNEGLPNGTLRRLGMEYKYNILNRIVNRDKKPLLQQMNVDKKTWEEKAQNLIDRRKKSLQAKVETKSALSDYKSHIEKCSMGKDILDIGCGSGAIKDALNDAFNHNLINSYAGVDPFPAKPWVLKMQAEALDFHPKSFDTVYAFAMLDNVQDFSKAISEMKRVCRKNIVILTGIGIEPDQYHTLKITEEMLYSEMEKGEKFKASFREYLQPKVLLIEFSRA